MLYLFIFILLIPKTTLFSSSNDWIVCANVSCMYRQGQTCCFFGTANGGQKDLLVKAWIYSCLLPRLPTMVQAHINFLEYHFIDLLRHSPTLESFPIDFLKNFLNNQPKNQANVKVELDRYSWTFLKPLPFLTNTS